MHEQETQMDDSAACVCWLDMCDLRFVNVHLDVRPAYQRLSYLQSGCYTGTESLCYGSGDRADAAGPSLRVLWAAIYLRGLFYHVSYLADPLCGSQKLGDRVGRSFHRWFRWQRFS